MQMLQKNPSFDFECEVLEFTSRPYTNKKGESVVYVNALLRLDSRVFRFNCAKDLDLSTYVGEKINLRFELSSWGDDLSPSIRAVALV